MECKRSEGKGADGKVKGKAKEWIRVEGKGDTREAKEVILGEW